MAVIKITDEKGKEIEYYMDDRLKNRTDNKVIPALNKQDKDWIEVIDGGEGSGKSTMAFQRAKYVDKSFNLSRVVFTPEEFKEAIFKAKKGQAIVYDEAFTGLSSRASLSPINKYLVSLMMQMRQKNLFVILVLPTFFLLDKYAALFRTKVLIHIYETRAGNRGYFRVYNQRKKKLLFLYGKPTYTYVKQAYTKFKGRFYGVFALGDEEELEKYKRKKEKALEATEKSPMSAGQIKYREQRDIILWLLRKNAKLTYLQISNMLLDLDVDMSFQQIRNICVKYGDKAEIIEEKKQIRKEKEDKKSKSESLKKEKKEKMKKKTENDEILPENDEEEPFIDDYEDFNEENEEIPAD